VPQGQIPGMNGSHEIRSNSQQTLKIRRNSFSGKGTLCSQNNEIADPCAKLASNYRTSLLLERDYEVADSDGSFYPDSEISHDF